MLWMVHVGQPVAAGTLITMGWLTGRNGPRTVWTLPGATLGLLGALLAPALAQRIPARQLVGGVLVLGALGAAVMAFASAQGPSTAMAGFAAASFAVGLVTTLTTDHILTAAELGIALGIALLGSLATAVLTRGAGEPLTAAASEMARMAFIDGMSLSAIAAAAILGVLAIVCIRHLQRRPPA